MSWIRRSADNAGASHAHRPVSVIMAAAGTVVLATVGGACGHANTASSSPPTTTLSTALPHVTAVSPGMGAFIGGTAVTITGSGFTGATEVDFGRVKATRMTVDSDSEITATSPSGASGRVDVIVVTPKGTSATSPADEFIYYMPLCGWEA
jgi:IPT/TIG domain-containing protein